MKNTDKVSVRNEAFAVRLAGGKETAADIYRDLYPKSRAWKAKTVHEAASRLSSKVHARVAEIQAAARDRAIMDVVQRKIVLSEIAAGHARNYLVRNAGGELERVCLPDDDAQLRAVLKFKVRKEKIDGMKGDVGFAEVTEFQLRDPIAAIAELNKMDGVYKDDSPGDEKKYVMVMAPTKPLPQGLKRE